MMPAQVIARICLVGDRHILFSNIKIYSTTGLTTVSPLVWETGSTLVDMRDEDSYTCQVTFDFILKQGVKVKNAKSTCSGMEGRNFSVLFH